MIYIYIYIYIWTKIKTGIPSVQAAYPHPQCGKQILPTVFKKNVFGHNLDDFQWFVLKESKQVPCQGGDKLNKNTLLTMFYVFYFQKKQKKVTISPPRALPLKPIMYAQYILLIFFYENHINMKNTTTDYTPESPKSSCVKMFFRYCWKHN